MPYYETDVPQVVYGGGNNGGMFGNDGIWAILLLALLGFGRGGYGFGGYGGNGGYVPNPATQADLANGFAQNTLQRGVDDIILGQANIQQTLCQGFSGVNSTVNQSVNTLSQGICNLGYNVASGFNAVSREIADCCCSTKSAISDLKYANEKQTCDIIQAINAGNQRLVDIYTNDKISALQTENATLKGQISNNAQSAYIISQLKQPCPIPAYSVPNPNCCYNPCGGTSTI